MPATRAPIVELIRAISETSTVSLFLFLMFYPLHIQCDDEGVWNKALMAYGTRAMKFWQYYLVLCGVLF